LLGPPNQQGAVYVIRGRPSQGASAVLKGAPLAPWLFLHAHSCLVASNCIEGSGPDQLSSDYWTTWVTTTSGHQHTVAPHPAHCCGRAASGHAAAAPPSSVITSR